MTIPVRRVELLPGVAAWFTGRPADEHPPHVGRAGNLSHRRPHEPARLAADRADVCERIGVDRDALAFMEQVHGASVTHVDIDFPAGGQAATTDGLVSDVPGRALVVQTADCVPVLLAAGHVVGAAHVGRRGLMAGTLPATLAGVRELAGGEPVRAVIGPAIGGCCYEVPAAMQRDVARRFPMAAAVTSWGTSSLDLRAALRRMLLDLDVDLADGIDDCTMHDDGWFSHRADPDAGRQLAVVVREVAA